MASPVATTGLQTRPRAFLEAISACLASSPLVARCSLHKTLKILIKKTVSEEFNLEIPQDEYVLGGGVLGFGIEFHLRQGLNFLFQKVM